MRRILAFLILMAALYGDVQFAKDKFYTSSPGDYIVTEQGKMVSFLTLIGREQDTILLEEINIPSSQVKKNQNWVQWYSSGMAHYTSHILYEIDLKKERVLRCYSLSRGAYLEPDAFLPSLLTLPLEKIIAKERKKIGPPPSSSELDTRKVWNPPLFREGKKISNPNFEVLKTRWPKDNTLLSRKEIHLYFDASRPAFPFPCWMEITDGSNTFKIRCVDTGSQLPLHNVVLPPRVPHFIGIIDHRPEEILLHLDQIDPGLKLHLFAKDQESQPQKTHTIPFEIEGNSLKIQKLNLKRMLTDSKRYRFFVMIEGHPEILLEHPSSYKMFE